MKDIHSIMSKKRDDMTRSYVGILTIMLALLLLSAGMAQAQSGSLEPPDSAFDGGGNPQATTQTQPSWDQKLTGAERFVLVMGGAAVLDHETGLVWQKEPGDTNGVDGVTSDDRLSWILSRDYCIRLDHGGRKGWRLPAIHELASLVDSSESNPALPAGHLFLSVNFANSLYWSATSFFDSATTAWFVNIGFGGLSGIGKADPWYVWCVRGGQNPGDDL